MTQGEFIDNMSIDEIINHPQFYSLSISRGLEGAPDFWVVTFESNKRNEKGIWITFNNAESFDKLFRYYKLKEK